MMQYNQKIAKQMIDFQKASFSSLYDAVALVQDQAASAVDTMLDQSIWLPEEGRQAIQSWINVCKSERKRLKTYVDNGYTDLEKFLDKGKKSASPKPKKAS